VRSRRIFFTSSRRDAVGALFAIGCVLVVTLWALHPGLLVANTLTAGGDTGAHVALPWFLRTQLLTHGHLTGWYPGWFDGFPLYTYYFVLSDLLAALGSYVIPYAVAFKLTTVLGSLLLPVCAYAMGRLFGLRAPIPACLAASTLPFLFESSFTISGGNLFSTLAGEYAFSLSLSLALIAVGLFARGLRTGRGAVVSAVALSATLAAHILPWLWALVGIALLVVVDLVPRGVMFADPLPADGAAPPSRVLSFALRAGALGIALSAWWLVPWVTGQSYAISMAYLNDGTPGEASFAHQLFPGGDRVMLCVALAGLATAWARRSRFAVWLTSLTTLSAIAYVLDPQGSLWDERLLPFWFFGAWLTCGWLFGVAATSIARRWRTRAFERWIAAIHAGTWRGARRPSMLSGWPAAVGGAICAGVLVLLIVLPPMTSFVPRSLLSAVGITPGANQVPVWSAYNFTGYQGVAGWSSYDKDWPEYHAVIQMMRAAGARHGCGQSMWEYDLSLGDFGTTESLMLLPYWTNNCIGSMEGLLFESSATTPFHFLNQSELSEAPSDPMVGLPYGPAGSPNVALGLEHLQLLGVRYFLAFTPSIVAVARHDPMVTQIAVTGPWRFHSDARTWHLFELRHAPIAVGLATAPNVVTSLASRPAWQAANIAWWLTPKRWHVLLAQSGPASWPRTASPKTTRVVREPHVTVTDARVTVSTVSFHVSRLGVPVLVHVSYYPRWHATGALGPYRVSPNLMAVVPTSHDVELSYEGSSALTAGLVITTLAVAAAVVALVFGVALRRRRAARLAAHTDEVS
jgi:hypothetical protein